jgi:hypothetical protein
MDRGNFSWRNTQVTLTQERMQTELAEFILTLQVCAFLQAKTAPAATSSTSASAGAPPVSAGALSNAEKSSNKESRGWCSMNAIPNFFRIPSNADAPPAAEREPSTTGSQKRPPA